MLLVADVGNTHMVLGLYEGSTLRAHWRAVTKDRTADELRVFIGSLLHQEGIEWAAVDGACVSCVVPALNRALVEMCGTAFGFEPIVVGPGIKTGLVIQVDNPKEVGADRIVNAVGAIDRYGGPMIIIDFGTGTNFDVISERHEWQGGIIFPGIGISLDALSQRCAKLPHVDLVRPPAVIGRNTITNIQSGMVYGFAEMCDGLIGRISGEMGATPTVIATGGYAELIASAATRIDHVDPYLTLHGLRLLHEKNAPVAAT